MNKFIIYEYLISILMDSVTVMDMVEASSSRHPLLVPFILQPFLCLTIKAILLSNPILTVASKRGQKTKKHALIGCQT